MIVLAISAIVLLSPAETTRQQFCAVVPAGMAKEAREILSRLARGGHDAVESRIVVQEDDHAVYVFLKDDPSIKQLQARIGFYKSLLEGLGSEGGVKLADFDEDLQAYVLSRLDSGRTLVADGQPLPIGITISEKFVLELGGRQVRASLRTDIQEANPIDRPDVRVDPSNVRPAPAKPSVLGYMSNPEDLIYTRHGPVVSTWSHAVLAEQSFKHYANYIKQLEEAAKTAIQSFFEEAFSEENTGLRPMQFNPENGFQIDRDRRVALLRSGIGVNLSEGLDDQWIKNSRVVDHYYTIGFTVRFKAKGNFMPHVSSVAIPFRVHGG